VDENTSDDGDVLPADLDPSAVTEPYLFPNNSRRRIAATVYMVMGVVCLALRFLVTENTPLIHDALVNDGVLVAGFALVGIGLYYVQAGWHLEFDEEQALQAAAREVGFPVGHASAQLAWRGLRSRPTWRVLLYSNEAAPTQRGLVLIDGINGKIVDRFVETNPEDWANPRNKTSSGKNL